MWAYNAIVNKNKEELQMNNYLSVCMFQLKCLCDCDSEKEYLIETREIIEEIERAFDIILKYQPDIALFPEMTYLEKYEKIKEFIGYDESKLWKKG